MEKQSKTYLSNTLSMPIQFCSLSKEDLKKLIEKLQDYNNEALEIEKRHLEEELKEQSHDKQYQKNVIKNITKAFELKVLITDTEGQQLIGSIQEVFEHNNFPDQVLTVYIDSSRALSSIYNYYPHNQFQLFIDFKKLRLIDFSITPSGPTPNDSNFKASGSDSKWTNGLFNEIGKFFKKKRSNVSWIHKQHIYDIILWLIGYPIGFWGCYKLSKFINKIFGGISIFVQSAAYVYVFLIFLSLIYFLFRYSRWVWPVVEYKTQDDRASKHRKTLGVIVLALVGAMAWDLIKYLSSN